MEAKSSFRIRNVNGKKEIYDVVRRVFVALTQEEMVRQAYLKYLIEEIEVPIIAISVEKEVIYNSMHKRYDIVVANPRDGSTLLIVECKAETVRLDESSLYQIAMYNSKLNSKYLVLLNGKQQIVLKKTATKYELIDSLPNYSDMISQE